MDKQKQRVAIANACGWVNCILPSEEKYHFLTEVELSSAMGHPFGRNIAEHPNGLHYKIPEYLNDLNAMHEAEKCLSTSERVVYYGTLWGLVGGNKKFSVINATAEQRAEAFLKTIGKWEES